MISSQAPHHRLHHLAPRGPLHGPLVAAARDTVLLRVCPREGYGLKGIHHNHCLSPGRGGGRPIGSRSEGGSSAPLEATRGRGSGWPQRPEQRWLPSASARDRALRVTERQSHKGHSDKHDAKHGARSGREQLPVRNEMTKPGASSYHDQP